METAKQQFVVTAPLFYKILGGIILPLAILLGTFTFMTVQREMGVEITRCIRQSEIVLKTLNEDFVKIFSEASIPPRKQSREEIRHQVDFLQKKFSLEKVDLVDPVTEVSLVDGASLKDNPSDFAVAERSGIPESLAQKRQGHSYYISKSLKRFSKEKAIFGYIPFRHKDAVQPLVLVTIFKTSLREVVQKTLMSFMAMFITTFLVGLAIALRLTSRIVRPIQAINRACSEMLNGNLGLQVAVRTGDEIETMAKNFNRMSQALMVMNRQAEDSNPLTQLPGNRQIMAELMHRIDEKRKFVYFHVDIDHFKAYNDHYGLGKGDDVLRRTGDILRECVADTGQNGFFLGHQGGDDFVLITEPYIAEDVAKRICKKFDGSLKDFYDKEALEKGYFMGEEARAEGFEENHDLKRHPLMSISLAGISNQRADFTSYDDVLQGAVRVKKKAKKIPYSKSLIEELKIAA